MDDNLRIFALAVGSGGFFGVAGLFFGALTGLVTHLHGRAGGGIVGQTVARAVARAARRELSPRQAAVLVGGAEGAVFLALVGVVLGLVLGYRGAVQAQTLLSVALGTVFLMLGAAAFGMTAYFLSDLPKPAARRRAAGEGADAPAAE